MEAPMTKCIRVDYTVKPDVDLDNLKVAITEFVAGIHSHHPEHRYTSFQHPAEPNRFIHIGEVVEEVLPDLQKQPFFRQFTEYLPGQCSVGPEVTRLDRVASTTAYTAVSSIDQ
jgi:hypothetical protein